MWQVIKYPILYYNEIKLKTLWQKEKLSIMSKFCFRHNVFKRLLLQMIPNLSEGGKMLRWWLSFLSNENASFHCNRYFFLLVTEINLASVLPSIVGHAIEKEDCHLSRLKVILLISPFPISDAFWCLYSRRLLKTFWQKEKLLNMNNFFFCHNVFNSIQ